MSTAFDMRISSTRLLSLALLTAPLYLGLACSDDAPSGDDAGTGDPDGNAGLDGSAGRDTGPVDLGPVFCARDQQCDPGEVCNVLTGECGAGESCTTDRDCDKCGDPAQDENCGHGITALSVCENNVCRRGLSNCEPCQADRDCAPLPPDLGDFAGKCLDYGAGKKFCGRSSRNNICPKGFTDEAGFCKAAAGTCPDNITVCPEKSLGQNQSCFGTDQLCQGERCPDTERLRCSGNDLPGTTGVCFDFCNADADCPTNLPFCNRANGLCTQGCAKDGCAAGQVCHVDGKCGPTCADDNNCTERFGENYGAVYCHRQGGQAPRYDKGGMNGYRDYDACAPLGCERNYECGGFGVVCDRGQTPAPLCVPGCHLDEDCRSEEVCKSPGQAGPQPNYTKEQCRALGAINMSQDPPELGVCCNPGCRDRVLQCPETADFRLGWWCCGEEGSAYESPASCGTYEDPITMQTRPAQPGECFLVEPPPTSPFCAICDPAAETPTCNSGWAAGSYDIDNNGSPDQELELCFQVAELQDGTPVAGCGVTCNPAAEDDGCPRGWACQGIFPTCLQDADCPTGLPCVGQDTTVDPPRSGQCKCGENGVASATCPIEGYSNFPFDIPFPRCVPRGPNMVCVATYNCVPPSVSVDMDGNPRNYSQTCLEALIP